jgi:hypothetical protein
MWGPIDPHELIRVAHGETDARVGPDADPTERGHWSDRPPPDQSSPPADPPGSDPADDDETHRSRFRLGRKKDRKGDQGDPPTFPGLEK